MMADGRPIVEVEVVQDGAPTVHHNNTTRKSVARPASHNSRTRSGAAIRTSLHSSRAAATPAYFHEGTPSFKGVTQ
jgi:hypothetical protein